MYVQKSYTLTELMIERAQNKRSCSLLRNLKEEVSEKGWGEQIPVTMELVYVGWVFS